MFSDKCCKLGAQRGNFKFKVKYKNALQHCTRARFAVVNTASAQCDNYGVFDIFSTAFNLLFLQHRLQTFAYEKLLRKMATPLPLC